MSQESHRWPVGIPLRPPPGWRPRAGPPPLPGTAPKAVADPLMRVLWVALVGLMVLVCMVVGVLLATPRRPRVPEEQQAEVVTAPGTKLKSAPVVKKVDEPAPVVPKPAKLLVEVDPLPPPKPEAKAPAAELTYEKHVLPILERACVSCHGAKKRGGLDLRTRTALELGGDNGPGFTPGNPDESPLWESITSGRMPPRKPGALSAKEKRTIREWIASGARGGQ